MSERTTIDRRSNQQLSSSSIVAITTTLADSTKILISNPQIFISIYTLTTLPISLLLVSLSLISHPIQSHINHLQSVTLFSSTRFEARHVSSEARADAISLFRTTTLLFSVPIFLFSLIAVIAAVDSTALAYHACKRPSFRTAVKAVKETWKRPSVTCLCVYAIMLACAAVLRICPAVIIFAVPRVLVAAAGVVIQVYLMAVTSLGLVVSVMEDRVGFDAIRVGHRIMQGRRLNGWILSGLFVTMTGIIELNLNGQALTRPSYWSTKSTVVMVIVDSGGRVGLVCLFGLVILFSYVASAVFYCECRKKHMMVKSEIEIADGEVI